MKSLRKLLYFASFVALAATAAVAIGRVGRPSIAPLLLAAVVGAAAAGAPGLIHRRAWPVALVLLPLGAYVLLRAQLPVPSQVHGIGQQFGFYLEQLRSGAHEYARETFPLDLAAATSLRVLLSLVVYSATGLAAFAALSLRRALPAIAIVLVVLGFGSTTDDVGRLFWAPFAFLLLAGCMLVLSRSLQRERWRATDALAGAATATIAALLALSLLGATSVAASKPLQDWRTWGFGGADSALFVFDWLENYPRLLDPVTNERVMRVRSPVASYWRANALDAFDGSNWSSEASYNDPLTLGSAWGGRVYAVPLSHPEPPGKFVTESFEIVSTYTDHLFVGGSPRSVSVARPVVVRVTDAHALALDQAVGPTLAYSVTAVIPQVKPADLLGRGRDYPAHVLAEDVALPFPARPDSVGLSPESAWRSAMSGSRARREWLGLYQLNQDIVGSMTDPYRITLEVERYLRAHFAYSLDPPRTGYRSPYAAFLFQTKNGYCQHFAGAMAVLLRFNGVPARVAVGFATGKRAGDGSFIVSRTDAHAWVEVYFPGVGWLPFEPTPGWRLPGSGASSANAGFVDPMIAGVAGAVGGLRDAGASAGRKPGARGQRPDRRAGMGGAATGTPAPSGAGGWLRLGAALVLALVAWPAGRALLRRRGLRRGSYARRLRASLALVYADLEDYGIRVPRSQTLDETARFLKGRLDLDVGALVGRLQAVFYGGRAATSEDLADVAALRRELKRRMRARSGRMRAVLALYGIPSGATVRV